MDTDQIPHSVACYGLDYLPRSAHLKILCKYGILDRLKPMSNLVLEHFHFNTVHFFKCLP